MGKNQLVFFVDFDPEIHKIFFAAGDQNAAGCRVVDGEAGLAVDEFDPVFALRYGDSRAVVEVEFYARKAAFLLHLAGVEGHIGFGLLLRLFLGQAAAAAFGKLRQFFVAG